MNYFFKFLMPQLLEYFNNDNEKLSKFIPKIVKEKYENETENLYIKNDKNIQLVEKQLIRNPYK